MLFCIRLPNFVQIGAPVAKIWRHIHFSRSRPRLLNTASGFVFVEDFGVLAWYSHPFLESFWDIFSPYDVTHCREPQKDLSWAETRHLSILLMSLPSKGQSLSANQISSTYLNSRLRYHHFWFWKTRPPYWISTSCFDLDHFAVIGVSFCIRLPNFVKVGTSTAEIWRHIDFQDGGRQPCCICFGVMADHPQTYSVLKSLVPSMNSSGDIAIRFWRFGLIFTPLFGKFLGHIFPIWRHPLSWAPKGPVVGGNTSFEPFSVRISAIVWAAWARAREKIQDNKKVTKVIYFPYFGEAPTGPIRPKCCIVGDVLSRVRRIKWNLHGLGPYDFTGVEFSIFLLIFARALQQRSANALPVMTLTVYVP